MINTVIPSFKDFQKDIERHLESEGKRERNEQGQMVYRGYQAAVDRMFRRYMEQGALAPLVAEFRKWNWEWGYNDYLLELSDRLQRDGDWPLLRELWAAVIAKRRTNYNKTLKAHRALPDKIPEDLLIKTRALLGESLHRLRRYASGMQRDADVQAYAEMLARVERRIRA